MSKLKLTYFDFHGGRGEPARLAMYIGGIEFEDYRFSFDKFAEVRKTTPLGQVPTLFVDGKQITQSNAINRFLGKMANLYPADNFQALLCDEIMDAIEDITTKIVATFGMEGDALKTAREALAAGPFATYLSWAEKKLNEQGGEYFVENRLTMADLKVFVWIRGLNSGTLDHISTSLVATVAPNLDAHCQRISQLPEVAAYYAKFDS
jgi:glutathione S-transferase